MLLMLAQQWLPNLNALHGPHKEFGPEQAVLHQEASQIQEKFEVTAGQRQICEEGDGSCKCGDQFVSANLT